MTFLKAIEYLKTLPIIPVCPYNNIPCDCKPINGDPPWFRVNGKIRGTCAAGMPWSKK